MNCETEKGLSEFNSYISDKTYVSGFAPSNLDMKVFATMRKGLDSSKHPHAFRYYKHMSSFTTDERARFPKAVKEKTVTPKPPLPDLTKPSRIPVAPSSGTRSVLITSALPYVNNEPHLGNIIGCVLSGDVYARFCRLTGVNTLYVCGTDEYGTATETKAFEEKTTPKEICDRYHTIHKAIYEWFHIAFDSFGRTSTPFQTDIAQSIFRHIEKNNLLVEQESEQLYCPAHDKFLADRFVEGTCPKCGYDDARGDQCDACGSLLNPDELINPHYKYDKEASITTKSTKHLYLNLPLIESELTNWVNAAGPGKWSDNTVQVTKSWLRDGLQPRCITRDLKWGTPVPRTGYENKVFYVWFDAPIGYISITAKHCASADVGDWKDWWCNPDNVSLVQFMGKDNIPFHTVIFPSSLLATRETWTLLDSISTTEYLNYEDGKFSKSRGLGVFGSNCAETGIPADVWRFYLLANRPETSDSEFSWTSFQLCNNSELLANLGNFCNRALTFIANTLDHTVPDIDPQVKEQELASAVSKLMTEYTELMQKQQIRDASRLILAISRLGNQYFQETKPWELFKNEETVAQGKTVLGTCVQLVYCLAIVSYPVMPGVSHHLIYQLGMPGLIPEGRGGFEGVPMKFRFDAVPSGHVLPAPFTLFSKLDKKQIDSFRNKYGGQTSADTQPTFGALLRVGQITSVSNHPEADKLYLVKVNLGDEGERNLVAGLRLHYTDSSELINKRVVVVCNLETAKIKNQESHGMILCADKKGVMGLLSVPDSVPLGTVVCPEGTSVNEKVKQLSIKEFKKLTMKTGKGRVMYQGAALLAGECAVTAERIGDSVCAVK